MRGFTLLETLMVVTVAGVVLAVAVPPALRLVDGVAVRAARGDVVAVLLSARSLALEGGRAVAVHVDSAGDLRVQRGAEVVLTRNIAALHGVQLIRTRDSLAYDAWGLGRGAANLSIIVRRRAAAETIFVSRLGRVR